MLTTTTNAPVFILFMVKLGFKDQCVSNKISKARRIIKNMTGNGHFPAPVPSLADFTAITDQLEAAEAAIDRSRLKTAIRNAVLETFTKEIKRLQGYVEITANGNSEIILSSGFDVRNTNTLSYILPAPVELSTKSTDFEGEVLVKWKPVKGKDMYCVEVTDDISTGNWTQVGFSTKAKITATNLIPGQQYFFRVSAINPAGVSPVSQPISGRPGY